MSRRVPLNPCDRLVYGRHLELSRISPGGNTAYMVIDVDGHIEPSAFRETLFRTMVRHPATIGSLRISFPAGRPFWKVPRDVPAAARSAAAQSHLFVDLSRDPTVQARTARLHPAGDETRWNHQTGPQVRFEQYALPDNRTRFYFRWPHFFMDAEGALWFLSQLGRRGSDPAVRADPTEIASDDSRTVNVLREFSWLRRIALALRGFASSPAEVGLKFATLPGSPRVRHAQYEVLHRHFTAEETGQVQAGAKRWSPAGPARYARFLAAGVLRAVYQFLAENGVAADACCITMPLRIGISDGNSRILETRPVPGNYLVTPLLAGRADRLADRRAIGDDILSQFQDFLSHQRDLSQWALMQAAAHVHAWTYPLIFKLPMRIPVLASGFSYYGEVREPLRALCGARVVNVWGGGPIAMPPGLNPVFSRFEDRLNLALTYDSSAVSEQMARRFLQLIEDEILESTTRNSIPAQAADEMPT